MDISMIVTPTLNENGYPIKIMLITRKIIDRNYNRMINDISL
jgi:hypothetical protein